MPPSFLNLIDMKNILLAIATAAIFGLMSQEASAQPNTDFRPDMTVYLYADTDAAPKGDPVYGKVIKTMGLDMKDENGLSGDETLGAGGELGNISDFARVDLYLPREGAIPSYHPTMKASMLPSGWTVSASLLRSSNTGCRTATALFLLKTCITYSDIAVSMRKNSV